MEESNVVMHISIVLCKVNLDFYERALQVPVVFTLFFFCIRACVAEEERSLTSDHNLSTTYVIQCLDTILKC